MKRNTKKDPLAGTGWTDKEKEIIRDLCKPRTEPITMPMMYFGSIESMKRWEEARKREADRLLNNKTSNPMATKKTTKMVEPQDQPTPEEQMKTDIEALNKKVAYLETKVKSQSESIHLMKTMCDSTQGVTAELAKKIKRVADVSGVSL